MPDALDLLDSIQHEVDILHVIDQETLEVLPLAPVGPSSTQPASNFTPVHSQMF